MQKVATSHEDLIHDVQLDYYGKRMATCSSDRTVKVYDVVEGGERRQVADLKGHDGPVWQVAWAHPMFGNLLASLMRATEVEQNALLAGIWRVEISDAGNDPEEMLWLLCGDGDAET